MPGPCQELAAFLPPPAAASYDVGRGEGTSGGGRRPHRCRRPAQRPRPLSVTSVLFTLGLLTAGLALLGYVAWARSSAEQDAWVDFPRGIPTICAMFPALGLSLVLFALGRLGDAQAFPPSLLDRLSLWFTGLAMLLLFSGVGTLLGVPFPRALRPRWLREREDRPR